MNDQQLFAKMNKLNIKTEKDSNSKSNSRVVPKMEEIKVKIEKDSNNGSNSRVIPKMEEVKVKTEKDLISKSGVSATVKELKSNRITKYDGDLCGQDEISRLFKTPASLSEKCVAKDNTYILHISATLESEPNVSLILSDKTCKVYNFSNNQFAELAVLQEHTKVITESKFSTENSNLLYTSSHDGTVKLWDLRAPNKSSVQFTDTTVDDNKYKQINCFDVSPNGLLLAAGTNLLKYDPYILFWDVRKSTLLGGYWDSHMDDITQVKFHEDDSKRLISGSMDGLINLYDLSMTSETDALQDSLNTGSSIEKLSWLRQDAISCITHTADIQFWKLDGVEPYSRLSRSDIAEGIRRKSKDFIYVVDVHKTENGFFVLAGSNYHNGECFRGLEGIGKIVVPGLTFPQNKQIVRTSWFNPNTKLLLSGGEQGIVDAWNVTNK